MQLTVKTLKGGKFTIEVENSNTVAEVKTVIVSLLFLCVNEMFLRFKILVLVLYGLIILDGILCMYIMDIVFGKWIGVEVLYLSAFSQEID